MVLAESQGPSGHYMSVQAPRGSICTGPRFFRVTSIQARQWQLLPDRELFLSLHREAWLQASITWQASHHNGNLNHGTFLVFSLKRTCLGCSPSVRDRTAGLGKARALHIQPRCLSHVILFLLFGCPAHVCLKATTLGPD